MLNRRQNILPLIEFFTVVAILAVLAGLFVIVFTYVQNLP
jgi:hypothetical protein